jgi:hypothetical protein
MAEAKNGILLYRASRDGFEGRVFHEKCNDKENTISIIQTNGSYVFGGFTAAKWSNPNDYISDSKAFLFSLRRKNVSCDHKLKIKDARYAIRGHDSYGPTFGIGYDIHIKDNSNTDAGSYSNLGTSYDPPPRNEEAKSFLAGSYIGWLTTEIEVYQINK